MNRWLRRVLILAAVAAVIVVLRLTVFRPEPVPVTVHAVGRGRVEDTVVNSRAGTIKSRLRSGMSPGIAGLVAQIPVKKGQAVKKGQPLLRLDDSELTAQVDLAARSLDAARATAEQTCLNAEQAAREYVRAQGLSQRGLLSVQQLEVAATESEAAAAACKATQEQANQARAALAAARATLAKTVITAPFDGVVLDITTEVGEWISPSPPGVFIPSVVDVIDPSSRYVSAPLDEADVERVHLGLPARITMDAFRNREFPAVITYVSSFVETKQEQNRTLTVEAEFEASELPVNLLPGLSADIEVILDARDDVLRIPTYALLEGNRVLVAASDKLEERTVETGLRNWAFTEVRSGLAEGDRVVVSLDRPEVKAGAKVKVEEEASR